MILSRDERHFLYYATDAISCDRLLVLFFQTTATVVDGGAVKDAAFVVNIVEMNVLRAYREVAKSWIKSLEQFTGRRSIHQTKYQITIVANREIVDVVDEIMLKVVLVSVHVNRNSILLHEWIKALAGALVFWSRGTILRISNAVAVNVVMT